MATRNSSSFKGTCAVTGCGGFIGSALSTYFEDAGWNVVRLSRTNPSPMNNSGSYVPFHLGDTLSSDLMNNVDVLIHCAYDFSQYRWADVRKVNIDGTEKLFHSANKSGIRKICYLSSISAFPGAVSNYGKAKLECELIARKYGGMSVRAGLVFSQVNSGVIASVERVVSRSPIIPLFAPHKKLYLCNLIDLCRFLEVLLLDDIRDECITVANAEPVTFLEVIRSFQIKHKRSSPVLIVPWRVAWMLLKMSEFFGIRPPFRSDSLLSFVYQNSNPDFSNFEKYKFSIRNNLIEEL